MKFRSTRGDQTVGLEDALLKGIAEDSGLFVPESLPAFSLDDFASVNDLTGVAVVLLKPFVAGTRLEADLEDILSETLHFPIPSVPLDRAHGRAWLLELFHGPTAAFKDVEISAESVDSVIVTGLHARAARGAAGAGGGVVVGADFDVCLFWVGQMCFGCCR